MCMIQRAISYHDYGTRLTYTYVKALLIDPTVTKVVLIGHSQGGIIISQVIDDLLSQLPAKIISKIEVYTFGSAASHFSNPSVTLRPKPSASKLTKQPPPEISLFDVCLPDTSQSKNVIAHMEHYTNEYDLVSRWGVLHSVQDILDTRYAGSVFIHMGASGTWEFFYQSLNPEASVPRCWEFHGSRIPVYFWDLVYRLFYDAC